MMSSKSGKCVVCLNPGEKKPGWHQCYLEWEPICRINSPEVQTQLHLTWVLPTGAGARAEAAMLEM